MSAAHHQGIVHGDIKTANILLDEHGNAYLSDFGIAREYQPEIDEPPAAYAGSASQTISPEQVLHEPITPLTDLYCLGLILYELLTGCDPFAGFSGAAKIDHCLHQPIPSARAQRGDLPPAIDDVIQRATDRQPAVRFPDACSLIRGRYQQATVSQTEKFVPWKPHV